jgi:lipopolysaccharide/colanic/teichoic acid biosynthesis glycosyltransferase
MFFNRFIADLSDEFKNRHFEIFIKRLFDLFISLSILLFGMPVLLMIAVITKFSSPGPIFYFQNRLGMNKKPFRIIKFRTMTDEVSDKVAIKWSQTEEKRITKAGSFLRDYGLDEFPQVINIIKGDMSIVGFRPPLPQQLDYFSEKQMQMFDCFAGVFSLAAIKGRRSLSMNERRDLYVEYAKNWSLSLDFYILFKSLAVVLGRQDARDIIIKKG